MTEAPTIEHRGFLIKPQSSEAVVDDGRDTDRLIWLIYSPFGKQLDRQGDSVQHAKQIIDEQLRD